MERVVKYTAHNERFGVMAAVAPQKRQCKLAKEYPAGSLVEAATTPSRWDVSGNPLATVRLSSGKIQLIEKLSIFDKNVELVTL